MTLANLVCYFDEPSNHTGKDQPCTLTVMGHKTVVEKSDATLANGIKVEKYPSDQTYSHQQLSNFQQQ
jgi:hypothetical protein